MSAAAVVAGILLLLLKWICVLLVIFVVGIFCLKMYLQPHTGKCRCKTDMTGKTVLITGGNSGIGLETARDLAWRGARVIIASRNVKRSEEAVDDIKKTTGNDKVEHRYLDLSKFSSVRSFAEDINRDLDRLDVLVNNAGCVGVKQRSTVDGNDLIMQINHLGPFLLTNLLLNKLIASKPSRIVNVSSIAHEFSFFYPENMRKNRVSYFGPLWYFFSYANTKLCNVLVTRALARRLPEGVTVNALHPGVVKTDILTHSTGFIRSFLETLVLLCKTAGEGAQTTIHLCVAPELENVSGKYFSECKLEPSKAGSDLKLAEIVWNNSMKIIQEHKTC